MFKRWALLLVLSLFSLPAFTQVYVNGTSVKAASGGPLNAGQWCFGSSCTAVSNGYFSANFTAGTAAVKILDQTGSTILSVSSVSISGTYYDWGRFTVSTTQTYTGNGNPYLGCGVGATYTQLDAGSVGWTCQSLPPSGNRAWVLNNSGGNPVGPATIAGSGAPTANGVVPSLYVRTDTQQLYILDGANGTSSNTWTALGGGGGSMTWPSAPGIAVYAGSNAWGTSLTAPDGTIVGTSDTQTLTNKTVNGVAPATFVYLDATSSIQGQLNGKQATLTNPVTGPGSGSTVGHLAVMGNTAGTQITDGGAVPTNYTLPAATNSVLGGVKPDGTSILNSSGSISVTLASIGAAPLASPTFTGKASTAASATGGAGFNIPQGSAPSAPVNGDIWTTTSGLFAQISGSTIGPFGTGSGGMVYPGLGIPVSTGSAWASSVTAPSGAIVGTTDTQTLTNKTVDTVTPTTMAFLDATSSVQTQLNGKQATLTNPVTGPGSGATVGHLAVMGNTGGTTITDGGAVPTLTSLGGVPTTTTVNGHALSSNVVVSASDVTTGTLPAAQLPNPSASSLGGVESYAAVSHQWINTISNSGVPASSQPTLADIAAGSSGTGTFDFSGATQLKAPVAGGFASAANGEIGYDSTNLNWHAWGNGVDNLIMVIPASTSITNNDCAKLVKSSNVITIGDFGASCNPVTSVSNSDGTITVSPSTGLVVLSLALAHANTWTALQTFGTEISIGGVTPSGATGTGNIVFGTSPSFVTPALGTPASGVITNLTGTCTSCTATNSTNAAVTANASNSTFYFTFVSGDTSGNYGLNVTTTPSFNPSTGTATFNNLTVTGTCSGCGSGSGISGGAAGQVAIFGTAATITSGIALGTSGSDIPQLSSGLLLNSVVNWASPSAIGTGTPAAGTFTSVSLPGDGTHAGIMSLAGNTTNPTIPANQFGWLGFNSTSATAYFFQPSTTAPAGGAMIAGTPSGNVSQVTYEALGGSGAGIPTGPVSGVVSGDVVDYTGTVGQQVDSGILATNLVTLAGTQTLTNKTITSPTISSPTLSGTVAGSNTIPLSILAQVGANTMLANVTGSTVNVTAASIPSGIQNYVAGTGYNQATGHQLQVPLACPDSSGSGTAQSCSTGGTTYTPAAYDCILYSTTTTNSGTGLTINADSLGAKSLAIPGASGWTTTLTANIVPANKPMLACYDGTNWDVQQTGTSASGGGGLPTTTNAQTYYSASTTAAATSAILVNSASNTGVVQVGGVMSIFGTGPTSATTTNGTLASSATSVTVVSTTGYPTCSAQTPCYLILGSNNYVGEIISATGSTGTTFTGLTRSLFTTTATTTLASGSDVNLISFLEADSTTVLPHILSVWGGNTYLAPNPNNFETGNNLQNGQGVQVGSGSPLLVANGISYGGNATSNSFSGGVSDSTPGGTILDVNDGDGIPSHLEANLAVTTGSTTMAPVTGVVNLTGSAPTALATITVPTGSCTATANACTITLLGVGFTTVTSGNIGNVIVATANVPYYATYLQSASKWYIK